MPDDLPIPFDQFITIVCVMCFMGALVATVFLQDWAKRRNDKKVSPRLPKLEGWVIGDTFVFTGSEVRNKITDVGSRVLVYIREDQVDPRNYNGPPYSVVEHVLDEYEIEGITKAS